MNVVVSNNKIDYRGFVKVLSLEEISGLVGNIDYLVYHKSNESQEQKVELLSKLKDRVRMLIYIRNREDLEQAVQMIVLGSEGKYIDDEFFLESSEELNRLIINLNEVTEMVQMGGVPVLSDFFNRYLKEGNASFNSGYLKLVKQAVETMLSDYHKKDMELLKMSTTATEIFSNSTEIIHRVRSEQQKLRDAVEKIEASREEKGSSSYFSLGGFQSVVFFPRVSYMKDRDIIRIKEVGSCMYLTSFMLCFREYLELRCYLRPKLVFLEPVGSQYEMKYMDYNWVTQENQKSMQGYYNNVVFTNYPSKEVMNRLLDDNDYDTFIIVDRLKTSKDHLLNCKGTNVKYVVSGKSMVDKLSLNITDCFSIIRELHGSMFTVPVFTDYPEETSLRQQMYMRICSSFYEMLASTARRRR